jgi:hypothetical protein
MVNDLSLCDLEARVLSGISSASTNLLIRRAQRNLPKVWIYALAANLYSVDKSSVVTDLDNPSSS